ncbi:hypothetical protein AU467_22395 [Mesorhizobium loti]|uniref:DUF922 domain-containing protein n=1 Tax=Rhizobium loti TaxID=381 RepID=A0A117N3I0_RHILI|nr:hypothetical protein AU467_22395 [Mesorhizobium loti]
MKFRLALTIPALLIPTTAFAGVKIDEKSSTYDLRGLTIAAIHEDILRNAPRDADGVVDGETVNETNWSLNFEAANGNCQISFDAVNVSITMKLPRWVDEAQAPADVQKAWSAYIVSLREHENQHRDIAVKAAEAVDRLIHDQQPASKCSDIKQRIRDSAKTILNDAEVEQEKYDENAPSFDID